MANGQTRLAMRFCGEPGPVTAMAAHNDLDQAVAAYAAAVARQPWLFEFPLALHESANAARSYLREGLTALFDERHQFAVEPALAFLYKRIGTAHFMEAAKNPA